MQGWKKSLYAAGFFAISGFACAQQPGAVLPADTAHYDARRECTVVGTVTAYTATGQTAPLGARVMLRIASGPLEVHLGDPRLLAANHFSIQSGDTLRIIGETLTLKGSQVFVARIIQNGMHALAVRTTRGFLVPYVAPRPPHSGSVTKGGV